MTHGANLIANGYLVVPIKPGEKRPALPGWQQARLTAADLAAYPDCGVGVLCGQGDQPVAAIDIDVSHAGVLDAVVAWCEQHLGITCSRVGAAPRLLLAYRAAEPGWSKALSIAFFDPLDPVKLNGKRNEQRIEVLGAGQQFVAYHTHPDTGRPYEWTDLFGGIAYVTSADLPVISREQVQALLAEFERIVRATQGITIEGGSSALTVRDGDDPFAGLTPRLGLTLEQGAQWLAQFTNTDLPYDDWVQVGMALHHEFNGAPEALGLWQQWGAGSAKNDPEQYGFKWASFAKSGHRPLTFAFVIKRAKECASRQRYTAAAEWKQRIAEAADEYALRERTCPEISIDIRLGDIEREALAQVLCDRFRVLGTKLPIAQCRKLVAEKRPEKARSASNLPLWAQGWVYVTDDDKFYRIDSDEWLSMQGFNARFNREMPRNDEGNIINSASWHALNDLELPHVTRGVYLPYVDSLFELDGTACVNLYRRSSVPAAATTMSTQGQEAVQLVLRHLRLILGDRPALIETLLAWMAHNAQRPGVKIRWAPLIKGVEGDGKTLLGKLMQAVMGASNVRMISPTVLGTDFTGWAERACVGVLEEVRIVGHSRHDIFNALKPYVTNDSVPIHRKGKDEYNIINVTNYLGFTNYSDALPLGDNDRRWLIVFTPFTSREQMEAAVAGEAPSLAAYFDRLHAAIETHAGELRRWLLDHLIPATFNPNGTAPETEEKRLMIALSSSSDEDEVRDVIEEGAEGVGARVLSSSCLTTALQMRQGPQLNTTALNRVLVKLGWSKVPKKVKWKARAHWLWVRGLAVVDTEDFRMTLRLELDEVTLKAQQKGVSDMPGSDFDPLFGDLAPQPGTLVSC